MQELAGALAAKLGAPWAEHGGTALLLAGCRCGPLLLAVPMLGRWGRLAALGLGTLLVAPLLIPAVAAADPAGRLGLGTGLLPLVARELLVGGTLALAAALPWAAAHLVGTLFDELRSARVRPPLAAQLYGTLALALFFGLGGARIALTALAASYELLPLPTLQRPLADPGSGSLAARGLVMLSGRLLGVAIRLALPLLCAQLLAELLVTLPGRWLGPAARGRSYPLLAARSLSWLAVLLLGAYALFPELRQLLSLWPGAFRQALDAR